MEENRELCFKHLGVLLKAAQEEYRLATCDRFNRQSSLLKTYIWLSTVLFGIQCVLAGATVDVSGVVTEPKGSMAFHVCHALGVACSIIPRPML